MLFRVTENDLIVCVNNFDLKTKLNVVTKTLTNEEKCYELTLLLLINDKYYTCAGLLFWEKDLEVLCDFMSFVSKQTIIMICGEMIKSKSFVDVISIIDDIIKSRLNINHREMLDNAFQSYAKYNNLVTMHKASVKIPISCMIGGEKEQ